MQIIKIVREKSLNFIRDDLSDLTCSCLVVLCFGKWSIFWDRSVSSWVKAILFQEVRLEPMQVKRTPLFNQLTGLWIKDSLLCTLLPCLAADSVISYGLSVSLWYQWCNYCLTFKCSLQLQIQCNSSSLHGAGGMGPIRLNLQLIEIFTWVFLNAPVKTQILYSCCQRRLYHFLPEFKEISLFEKKSSSAL